MKKMITLAAMVVLATGHFALAEGSGKKGCCGTCKKGEAVQQAECAKEKACNKEAKACAKKAGDCGKEAAAEKADCSSGVCSKTK